LDALEAEFAGNGIRGEGDCQMNGAELAHDLSLWGLFWQAHLVVKAVMIGLAVASVWTWAIIVDKLLLFRRLNSQMDRFEEQFGSARRFTSLQSRIDKVLDVTIQREAERYDSKLLVLATVGSAGPFIGLFGTVWGILRAFQRIGATGSASIQTVGPDIAHALIATAVGLAAAIPAVMAYNYFNSRIRVLNNEMDNFSSDFLNIVKRHFRGR
jgi:biopolymer transport protein TolQ